VFLFFSAHPAQAAVFIVPDGDVAAFKTAINASNTNSEEDTIELASGGHYTLTDIDNGADGLPVLGSDAGRKLTMHGNDATIQRSLANGTPMFRILEVGSGANVTISSLTISNGLGEGAGISNSGTLTLTNSVVSNNSAPDDFGGGILNSGHLIIIDSLFSGNSAVVGAAIDNEGTDLTMSGCVLIGNSAAKGGAIYNIAIKRDTMLTIRDSMFDANMGFATLYNLGDHGDASVEIDNSSFSGSSDLAVYCAADLVGTTTTTINNSTFSANSGGAIHSVDGGGFYSVANVHVRNSTLSGNTSGYTIYNDSAGLGGSTTILNTIINSGGSGGTLGGYQVISLGYNLSNDSGGGFLTATGDQINTDPMLDPAGLQNHGGPTDTIALMSGSPAIHAGNPNAPARDQRYYLRNGAPDKGAFEYNGMLAPITVASRKTHGTAGAFDLDLLFGGIAGVECRNGGLSGIYQLIATFATPVMIGSANVTTGTGSVTNASVIGSQVTINLTGVANAQQIVLTVSSVNDGANTNNVIIPMRVLLGDTTGNSSVNSSDVSQTKGQVGQAVTSSNFRTDVNLSGTISASDVATVKAKVGTVIPIPLQDDASTR
jgi:hypothetical protein